MTLADFLRLKFTGGLSVDVDELLMDKVYGMLKDSVFVDTCGLPLVKVYLKTFC